jgi:hypothetical protein
VAFDPTAARDRLGSVRRAGDFSGGRRGKVLYKFISPMTPERSGSTSFCRESPRCAPGRRMRLAALIAGRCPRSPARVAAADRRLAALDDYGQLEDPALQARFEHITHELRCLVCQNESIADSNANSPRICAGRCARCCWPARATMQIFDS